MLSVHIPNLFDFVGNLCGNVVVAECFNEFRHSVVGLAPESVMVCFKRLDKVEE